MQLQFSSVGKYPVSTLKNSKAAKWSTGERFAATKIVPMPHHSSYNPSDTNSVDPSQFILSTRKTLPAKRFTPLTDNLKQLTKKEFGGIKIRAGKFTT